MKEILFTLLILFNLTSYAQTDSEAKKMLKSKKYEIDSNYHQYISSNSWQFVYRYDRTLFKRKWKRISIPNYFEIDGNEIKYVYPNKPSSNKTAEVYFEDYRLIVKNSEKEITFYDVVDFKDNTYMILEVVRYKGWRGSLFRTPKVRLLYKKIALED